MLQAHRNKRKRLKAKRRRQTGLLPPALSLLLQRLHRHLAKPVVPSLPALGEFATDALGRELARTLRMEPYPYP